MAPDIDEDNDDNGNGDYDEAYAISKETPTKEEKKQCTKMIYLTSEINIKY